MTFVIFKPIFLTTKVVATFIVELCPYNIPNNILLCLDLVDPLAPTPIPSSFLPLHLLNPQKIGLVVINEDVEIINADR